MDNYSVEEKLTTPYLSQYPLGVFDYENNNVYFSSTEDNLMGDQLFCYDVEKNQTTQLSDNFNAINYILLLNKKIYLVSNHKGKREMQLSYYDKNNNSFYVYEGINDNLDIKKLSYNHITGGIALSYNYEN